MPVFFYFTFASVYSFKYNQQDATLYNILYYVNALRVSGGFSAQLTHASSSSKQV